MLEQRTANLTGIAYNAKSYGGTFSGPRYTDEEHSRPEYHILAALIAIHQPRR